MGSVYKNRVQKKLEEKLGNTKANQYVLMFHSVSPKEMWYQKEYCITPESFEHMIIELRSRGVRFVPVNKLNEKYKSKTVAITFDDVFADIYINAYPVLRKYKIPFTLFVTTDFIGKDGMITRTMLKEFSKGCLCTIGAHTFSHRNLADCTIYELIKEIYGAKRALEVLLKKRVEYLAYPYGNMVHIPMAAVVAAYFSGYKGAFSTIAAPVCKYMRYVMPRINVNEYNWKHILSKCSK